MLRDIVTNSYLHKQQADYEPGALAVAHLPVVEGVRLHHVEQRLLAQPVLLLEEVVLGVRARYVPTDHFLARRFRLSKENLLMRND